MQDIPRDILIRASRGNIEAFEHIYKAVSGFVYNVALRITNSSHDAEEVTQDVFMKVYRSLPGFQFRSSLRTWIYRITVNTALNSCKKAIKETSRRGDYDTAVRTQSAPETADARATQADHERAVASLLSALNPDQRACVVLREIEGFSYKQISEALKININTVRSRLKRARETLLASRKSEVG
ncbi:MAG TPA: RNA polymerase sigma factor [Patescibacteria group bacterium]|nr:RNA polymerase sigma factor [Patescibacteria group bacterium]